MRRALPILLIAALAAGCAASTPKTWPTAPDSSTWTPFVAGYLAHGQAPDGDVILAAPPAPGTAAFKADRDAYLSARKLAGGPRWSQAISDADLSGVEAFKSFSCAAGATINDTATPTLAKLMQKIAGDAGATYEKAKSHYARPRPPVGDKRPICAVRESWIDTNGSYPSGHALIGWTWALVLAEMAPDRQNAILNHGKRIGDSRVVCGVHYPSDIEAGRMLGSALLARLHADPQFQADFAAAKAELATAPKAACPAG